MEPSVVAEDVDSRFTFAYDADSSRPIPAIMPRFLMDMYNLAYADSMGLPKINEAFMLGKHFTLHVGETYFMGGEGKKTRDIECQVVGLTGNPSLIAGVFIPLRHAEELNEWYSGKTVDRYTAMHVTVDDLDKLDTVTSGIEEMSLVVEGNKETYDTIRFTTRAAGVVIACFAGIIATIAAVCILNLFSLMMFQRAGEAALMRAVGGTRRLISGVYLTEAGIIALAGSLLGVAVTYPLLRVLDTRIMSALPDLPFLPERLFAAGPGLAIVAVIGAVVVSLVSVSGPIFATVRAGALTGAES